ncbi:MAG: DUF308 domain-containing protein [Lachnospiraceae bacterium]|nr:DUF308 domain-containing protein [Lachnospiraceae bacterium]
MNQIKANMPAFILFLAEAAVGVLLVVNPIGFTSVIIRAIGIGMAAGGLIWSVKYFRTPVREAAASGMLFCGIVSFLLGIFLITRTTWLITTLTILLAIYALILLFLGILKLQWTVDLIRMKRDRWGLSGISAVIAVIIGALILWNPFKSTEVIWKLAGAALLTQAVIDIVSLFLCPRIVAKEEKDPHQKSVKEDRQAEQDGITNP